MLTIVGTVPDDAFPLCRGRVVLKNGSILINGIHIPVNRGTPALIGAAVMAGEVLGIKGIEAVLAGDIGLGKGSRQIYDDLTRILPSMKPDTLVFHYFQPDVDWHNRVLFAMEAMGGTGDTLTGLVCALIESGMDIPEAARIAARTNRLADFYASPTPATQVLEIIQQLPEALSHVLQNPNTDG
jgi:LmbE family N-acetylglucosaminyl deacetylase